MLVISQFFIPVISGWAREVFVFHTFIQMRRQAFSHSKTALLTGVALLLAATGCDNSSDGVVVTALNNFSEGTVSANDSGGTGQLTRIDGETLQVQSVLTTGGNQGVVYDSMCNSIQAGHDVANSGVVFLSQPSGRSGNAVSSPSVDGFFTSNNLANPKGIDYVPGRGLVLVANNANSNVLGFGVEARGSTATPGNELFTTAALGAAPWDLDYDETNDRLFVAVTNGTVAVFDNFLGMGLPNGRSPDRVATPFLNGTPAQNLHGIHYDRGSDTLVLTDVGNANLGQGADFASDGKLFMLPSASTAVGNVDASNVVEGPSTFLGNPVDVTVEGNRVFVAEKANGAGSGTGGLILQFQDLPMLSGNVSPISMSFFPRAESIAVKTSNNETPRDVTDINGSLDGTPMAIIVVSNPAGTTDAMMALSPTDLTALGFNPFTVPGGISLENVTLDNNGSAFVTGDNDAGSPAQGTGSVTKITMPFRMDGNNNDLRLTSPSTTTDSYDSLITGGNTVLQSPKGLDISDDKGLFFIAENGTTSPGITVFGVKSSDNVAPFFRATDLGLVGRRPWDLDYDPRNDRMFVACTDGTCVVFDNFVATQGAAGPSRTILPAFNGAGLGVNLHGVIYDEDRDMLLLSDVGSAGSNSDGQIFVIAGGASADGLTDVQLRLAGGNTNLGNPVDIAYDGTNLFVAEKANNMVLRYNNILGLSGDLDRAADVAQAVTAPESVSIQRTEISVVR